jgi:hypothetical protein
MARNGIIDGTVFFEKMVKTSSGVDGARMVEFHRVLDMAQQEIAATEVRFGGGHRNPLF